MKGGVETQETLNDGHLRSSQAVHLNLFLLFHRNKNTHKQHFSGHELSQKLWIQIFCLFSLKVFGYPAV